MDSNLVGLLDAAGVMFVAGFLLGFVRWLMRRFSSSVRNKPHDPLLVRWPQSRWPRWLYLGLGILEAILFLVGAATLALIRFLV